MSRGKLVPFSLAGVLDYCPECGARGDYDLLKQKADAVIAVWDACGRFPDTSSDRSRLDAAIKQMESVIGMMRSRS